MEQLVHAENLERRFGRVEALRGLTLDVGRGEVVALIGPNGAGKTTALRTIANVLQPSAGHAEVLGVDSRCLGPNEFRRIGYVSESQELPLGLTAAGLLAFLRPLYPAWDERFASELLVQFRIPLHRKLRDLSRGMRAKVALASSLAYRPDLLLLDEPFSGLDPLVREEVIDGILALDDEQGWSVLLCSHDIDEVERLADRVAILDRGRLALVEQTEALLSRHRRVEIVTEEGEAVPPIDRAPESWLALEREGRSVTFVETRFDDARTTSEIQRFCPRNTNVTVSPMSLRAIFIVLARQFELHLDGDTQ